MWFLLVFVSVLAIFSILKRFALISSQTLRRDKLKWTYLARQKDGRFHSHSLLNTITLRHSDYFFFETFGQNFSKGLVRKTIIKLKEMGH